MLVEQVHDEQPSSPGAIDEDALGHLRHDLRTAINQILGYGEMIEEELESSGLIEDVRRILRAGRTMLELVNQGLQPQRLLRGSATSEWAATPTSMAPSGSVEGEAPPEAPAAPVAPRGQGERILIVDDLAENRDLLQRRLEREGYTVLGAEDGERALSLLAREPVDLVLLDLMMPGLDGFEVLTRMKADTHLRHLPVIMISALDQLRSVVRCIEIGAEDYLSKPFDPTLLRARIGASLDKKRLRDAEQRTYNALVESERRLADELAEASAFVRSILPPPGPGTAFSSDWRFVPSTQLGGDIFGHHPVGPDHHVLYLLDVCGHGVGAAMLSISVMAMLRQQRLDADPLDPAAVLAALNDAFPMEEHGNMYFTIWYGAYHRPSRTLTYSSGGHPPAVLVSDREPRALRTPGMVVGAMPGVPYQSAKIEVPRGAYLWLYSDGCYEIKATDGQMLPFESFVGALARASYLDDVVAFSRDAQGRDNFDDDFSLLRFVFED